MNHLSSRQSYSTSTNFTIDNTSDGYDYNFFRDFMLCTFISFIFWMFGHFLEDFGEHLRRHRNPHEDNDLGFDFFDYMMFFD